MGQDPNVQNVPDVPILVRKHLEHKKAPQNQRLYVKPLKIPKHFVTMARGRIILGINRSKGPIV
jgi:hypothetical protein